MKDPIRIGRRRQAIAYGALAAVMIATLMYLPEDMHPLVAMLIADLVGTLLIFGFSVHASNSSLYDPYWSVVPIYIAVWWWAGSTDWQSILLLMTIFLWGGRLTYNFLRGWPGIEHEDWRYADFRKKVGGWYWPLSFFGFHLMPTLVVFAGMLPVWYAFSTTQTMSLGANLGIVAGAIISIGATILEATADEQLKIFRDYRTDPAAILDTGVWSWCRHPNYLGEILFWWGLWLIGVSANSDALWTAIGPLSITVLFVVISIPLIDARMIAKRPHYVDHIKHMPALVPLGRQEAPAPAGK